MSPLEPDNIERRAVQEGTVQGANAGVTSGVKRLGQILIEEGEIDSRQLVEALQIQATKGGFLGQILVDLKYVQQEKIVASLVKQCKIPHLNLLDYEISKDVLLIIPREVCLQHNLLPIDKLGKILTVAMVNPLDTAALEEVRALCPDLRVKPILCDWQHFNTVCSRVYGVSAGQKQEFSLKAPAAAPRQEPAVAPPPPQEDQNVLAAIDEAVREVIDESPMEEPPVKPAPRAVVAPKPAPEVRPAPETVSAAKRRVMAGIDNPELLSENDERVLEALRSEQLAPEFTFGDFVAGGANAFTFKLCRSISDNPGGDYNPMFIYGGVGLGKTHLISAIGNNARGSGNRRVAYISSSRFAERATAAVKQSELDTFRQDYCQWDILILDDIQFLAGRIEAQEEMFHIFNALLRENRQIIIAADKAPDNLGLLEQRLVSRFSSGIVAAVKPPEWETRVEILRRRSSRAKAPLPEEILSLIAMRVPGDIRKMLGALKSVMAYAELIGGGVSCEKAGEILTHLGVEAA
jgi:chromosomal replication initiator protein DnaA